MHKFLLKGIAAAALLAAAASFAQQAPAGAAKEETGSKHLVIPTTSDPFPITQVTQDVFFVGGNGGNSGVIVGDKGVIVFDTKTFPIYGQRILDAIATVTPKPVTTVILSHSDLDHIGGVPAFAKSVKVIAHENCKKEIEGAIAAHIWNAPSKFSIPDQVVTKEREEFTINGVKLVLIHTAPAHTSGDIFLYLPEKKIVFGGDLITLTRVHALVHAEKGGTSEGYISMLKAMVDVDADKYVSGHGGVIDKAGVKKLLDDLVAERNQVKALIAQGKSLKEIETITGDPTPEEAHGYGPVPPFPPLAEVIYNETTQKAGN